MIDVRDLGRRIYKDALLLQHELAEQRRVGSIPDMLLLVEHDPVYTLGRSAKREDLLLNDADLARRGIDVCDTDRGGQITYHGPGQLVAYPILNLADRGWTAPDYVTLLEEIIASVLSRYGLSSNTDRAHRGVWVDHQKIAAIGVRVTRRISLHGVALNVRVPPGEYDGIIPCGIRDRGVTSIHLFIPDIQLDEVKTVFTEEFLARAG